MIFSYDDIQKLMNNYSKHDNFIAYTINGGLCDSYIMTANGCMTCIAKEVYLNEWSSGYSIRLYNKIPKKYEKVIELLEQGEQEQAEKLFY